MGLDVSLAPCGALHPPTGTTPYLLLSPPFFHPQDMYSGLVGPLAICRKGILEPHGGRSDMDQEFALLFLIFDENQSWYLEENVASHGSWEPGRVNLQDETFMESNKMHGL